MLLWISESWTITSLRPSRCPITVTLVEWPPTSATASSAPCMPRQRLFELAMHRPLAGDRAARRDRGAVAVDRRLRRRGDPRVAVEADVIVGGEIDVGAVADHGFGAGDPLMHAKERVGDAEIIRRLLRSCGFRDRPSSSETSSRPASRRCRAVGAGAAPRPAASPRRGQLSRSAAPWPAPTGRRGCDPTANRYSAAADLISTGIEAVAASPTAASRSDPRPPRSVRPALTTSPPCGRAETALARRVGDRGDAGPLGQRHQRQVDPQPAFERQAQLDRHQRIHAHFRQRPQRIDARRPAAAGSSPPLRRRRGLEQRQRLFGVEPGEPFDQRIVAPASEPASARISANSGAARIGRKRRASFQLVSAKAGDRRDRCRPAPAAPASACAAGIGLAPSRRASASRVSGRSAR